MYLYLPNFSTLKLVQSLFESRLVCLFTVIIGVAIQDFNGSLHLLPARCDCLLPAANGTASDGRWARMNPGEPRSFHPLTGSESCRGPKRRKISRLGSHGPQLVQMKGKKISVWSLTRKFILILQLNLLTTFKIQIGYLIFLWFDWGSRAVIHCTFLQAGLFLCPCMAITYVVSFIITPLNISFAVAFSYIDI